MLGKLSDWHDWLLFYHIKYGLLKLLNKCTVTNPEMTRVQGTTEYLC